MIFPADQTVVNGLMSSGAGGVGMPALGDKLPNLVLGNFEHKVWLVDEQVNRPSTPEPAVRARKPERDLPAR
jgi:hypothetical protein